MPCGTSSALSGHADLLRFTHPSTSNCSTAHRIRLSTAPEGQCPQPARPGVYLCVGACKPLQSYRFARSRKASTRQAPLGSVQNSLSPLAPVAYLPQTPQPDGPTDPRLISSKAVHSVL